MNLLGISLVFACAITILVDKGYKADQPTFWAILLLTYVYVSTKMK